MNRASFAGIVVSFSAVLLMVTLALAAVFGVILYRMSMVAALNVVDEETIKVRTHTTCALRGVCLNKAK